MRVYPPQAVASTRLVSQLTSPSVEGIKASLLIPGRGQPIPDGALVMDDGQIAWVGQQSAIPASYQQIPFTHVPVLMPGLWDCHQHFTGEGPSESASGYEILVNPSAMRGARAAYELQTTLLAGVTSVREVAGYAGEIAPAIEDGTIVGPNVYSSHAIICMTGGHGDPTLLPIATVRDASVHNALFAICDGVPECIKTVRLMVRRGAKLIKVSASGGVYSHADDPEDAQFSPEELKAMVDEAARSKRIVAAHCHGKESILNAINAGVRTIEHGSYLDEECINLMNEKGVILIATRQVLEAVMENPALLPPGRFEQALKIYQKSKTSYMLAIKSGVKIALGTDFAAGHNGKEFQYAVEAGMTPLEAIEAGTANAPETLGAHFAPLSGQLREGYHADVIALSENPLDDIRILGQPKKVTHVWKGGKLYKAPERTQ